MDDTGIAALLEHMKDSARNFSEGGSPRLQARLSDDFLRFAELVKLFLISERDSYYGYILMSMAFEVDFEQEIIAGIKLDSFPPVFVSNPLLLSRFDLKEILYIFCHEIDHIVYRHPIEMSRVRKENGNGASALFNLAADAAVNDMLDLEIERGRKFLRTPQGVVTSHYLAERYGIDGLLPLQSYRYYFDALLRANVDIEPPAQGVAPLPRMRDSDPLSEGAPSEGDGKLDREHGCDDADSPDLCDHQWTSDDFFDEDAQASTVRKLLNDAYGTMDEEAKALMPKRFIEQVENANEPPQIPWQSMLKRYVGTMVAGRRKTRSRLNRRQPLRYDLAGSMESKELKLVVAIDTSASVSPEDLGYIFNEIFAILNHKKYELTVIECDSEIRSVYKARSIADIRLAVEGRGGTMFSPVIDYVNERRDLRGCLLIYFTDGFGEQRIPQPKSYKMLWVILDDETALSVEEPFGSVVPLRI